jgi:hypothetical protein
MPAAVSRTRGMGETADGVRSLRAEVRDVVEAACGSREFAFAGANSDAPGNLRCKFALVIGVGYSSIVGVERKLMAADRYRKTWYVRILPPFCTGRSLSALTQRILMAG